jgi:hypothetical protein
MIQHIPVVAQNESINDLKIKYSLGYNLINILTFSNNFIHYSSSPNTFLFFKI